MQNLMDTLRADMYAAAGKWRKLSADTGIHYDTISRIARAFSPSPRMATYFQIREWLDANMPKPPRKRKPKPAPEPAPKPKPAPAPEPETAPPETATL